MIRNILVTGATGFVGTALIKHLVRENFRLTAAVLAGDDTEHLPAVVEQAIVEPLSESSDYTAALHDVDIIIHLAARVHVMQETAIDPLQEFRKVNLHGTERLALQAAQAGVKRFVFMSTIGVNGNSTNSIPFTENDAPHPHNIYSLSKYEAELALRKISTESKMEVVIIRAPIVYGPCNPGNFLSLLKIVSQGIPLPLASIQNRRSLIYVGNLVDALAISAVHPSADGKTYLVSDGDDISTPELIYRTASALGVPARLFPAPVGIIRLAGKVTGKSSSINGLLSSLVVDSSAIRTELGWRPPFTLDEGLRQTALWFSKFS
ncbi:NAD-dependent epimerase/dehydratase family protein [Geotalea toluenoxydans]